MENEKSPKGIDDSEGIAFDAPASVPDLMEKGGSLFKEAKYHEALEAYNSALELDPAHGPAYFNRSLALNKLGESDRALTDLKVAARFGHEKSQALLKKRGIGWWL
jgi:tetratricopeptide (TPR) repeat protein